MIFVRDRGTRIEDLKVPLDSHDEAFEESIGDKETKDHVCEPVQGNNLEHSGFVDQIVRALESNGGDGVRIDVPNFPGCMPQRLPSLGGVRRKPFRVETDGGTTRGHVCQVEALKRALAWGKCIEE